MKILLINANPVVSRLLALCTREAHLLLDEVTDVNEVKNVVYDLIFVDDGSYMEDIDTFLEEEDIRKKIFISYNKDTVKGFDETIKKPFLPSQIIKVIESIDMSEAVDELVEKHSIFPLASEDVSAEKEDVSIEEEGELSIFSPEVEDESTEDEEFESSEALPLEILDSSEIEKIKALLDMDDDETELVDDLSEDEVHFRKIEVIKEQLIADGLEIVEEEEIIDVLSAKGKKSKFKNKAKSKREEKKKQKSSKFTKDELASIEDAVAIALEKLKPKKMKKLLKGKKIELNIKLEDNN